MQIKKIRFPKSMKFLTLLMTSMLIATVSASVYNYMYQNATIGVEALSLKWTTDGCADNATAGTEIAGVTVSLTNLTGPPNGTRVYGDPVRLKNIGSGSITFDLRIDDVTGSTVNMSSIHVNLYSLNTTAYIQNLTVWENNAKGSDLTDLSIPLNNVWRFEWEIKWKSVAIASDSVTVKLKLQTPAA